MKKNNLLWLRRLHGRLHERMIKKKEQFYIWRNLTFPLGIKIYLVGTPEHINVGDSAIVLAERDFLQQCGLEKERIKEITVRDYKSNYQWIVKYIKKKYLICWHGGGNMGNQWIDEEYFRREAIMSLKDNPMIIFPQTFFYTETVQGQKEKDLSVRYYNNKKNLTIVAREKKSYQLLKMIYPDTKILLTPDIVFSLNIEALRTKKFDRTEILLCLREDTEKSLTTDEQEMIEHIVIKKYGDFVRTDMYSDEQITKDNREKCVRKKVEEFMRAKLVITDRLHAMIFAAKTGTPCIVLDNNNHKVCETYEWIKSLPYIQYIKSVGELEAAMKLLKDADSTSDDTEWKKYYKVLEEEVKKYI